MLNINFKLFLHDSCRHFSDLMCLLLLDKLVTAFQMFWAEGMLEFYVLSEWNVNDVNNLFSLHKKCFQRHIFLELLCTSPPASSNPWSLVHSRRLFHFHKDVSEKVELTKRLSSLRSCSRSPKHVASFPQISLFLRWFHVVAFHYSNF